MYVKIQLQQLGISDGGNSFYCVLFCAVKTIFFLLGNSLKKERSYSVQYHIYLVSDVA